MKTDPRSLAGAISFGSFFVLIVAMGEPSFRDIAIGLSAAVFSASFFAAIR